MRALWLIPLILAARAAFGVLALRTLPGDATARALLERAYRAEQAVTLAGTAQVRRLTAAGEQVSVCTIWRDGPRLRIDYVRGDAANSGILDDGDSLYRLDFKERVAYRLPRGTPTAPGLRLPRHYSARATAADVVANRPTTVLELWPRGAAGPIRRLWLDRETGYPLRQAEYDSTGQILSVSGFEQVDFAARPPQQVFQVPEGWRVVGEPAPDASAYPTTQALSQIVGFAVIEPDYIPPGFALAARSVARHPRWGRPMAVLTYSDGLKTFSVFEHPCWGREGGAGRTMRGAPVSAPGQAAVTRGRGPGHRHRFRGGRGPAGIGVPGGGRGAAVGGRRGWCYGFGPPEAPVAIAQRGPERAVRLLLPELIVVVAGDLDSRELVRIAKSVHP